MKGCRRSMFGVPVYQQGVGLIEVLVALLVISIGILGMAGLQTWSLQHNQLAFVRSQSMVLANDMMDRIRANRTLAESTSSYLVDSDQYQVDECTDDNYPNRCESGLCTAQELATYDLQQWKFQIKCQLPSGKGSIASETTGSGPLYKITLEFNESRTSGAPTIVELRGGL